MTALAIPARLTHKQRNRAARIATNPNALTLESVFALLDELAAIVPTLKPRQRPPVVAFLDAVRSWATQLRTERVTKNTGLVYNEVFKTYASSLMTMGISEEDGIQEGLMGLDNAAMMFDMGKCVKGKPVRFSTYACLWIKQHLRRLIQTDRIIRIPCHVQWQAYQDGRPLPAARPLSLDAGKEGRDNGYALKQDIPDTRDARQIEQLDAQIDIQELLLCLPERDRQVIRMRFFEGKTLLECGALIQSEYGNATVTRERIRQLEARALARLKVEVDRRRRGLQGRAE